jgi:acyl transferase domain-containing protein
MRAALAAGTVSPAKVAALQTHGTGTSLGDPIEVGALGAVFQEQSMHSMEWWGARAGVGPLALLASKTWTGHAEPAAGIVGLLHARVSTAHEALLPVLHLRAMNSYVESGLARAEGSRGWSIPRGGAGLAATLGRPAATGVSAFAFQASASRTPVRGCLCESLPHACSVAVSVV